MSSPLSLGNYARFKPMVQANLLSANGPNILVYL